MGLFARRVAVLRQGLIQLASMGARFDALQSRIDNLDGLLKSLEHFSHGGRATYIGNNRVLVKIVVQNNHIAYIVEADDKLLSPWFIITGTYETELTSFFVRELRLDSHCIDVGTNFGYFTCLMGRFCPKGKIIGIEADQKLATMARDNLSINGFDHSSSIIHAAASDNLSDSILYRRDTRSGNTSIAYANEDLTEYMGEAPVERFSVKSVRLDDLQSQMTGRVDFIKIDVEGAEPLVFRGAEDLISKNHNLHIVMEWSPGQIQAAGFEISAFLAHLDTIGLTPFDIQANELTSLSFSELINLPYRAGIVLKRRL